MNGFTGRAPSLLSLVVQSLTGTLEDLPLLYRLMATGPYNAHELKTIGGGVKHNSDNFV
jgi:hypothetical protein